MNACCLFAADVLGEGLGSLTDAVLDKFTKEEYTNYGLEQSICQSPYKGNLDNLGHGGKLGHYQFLSNKSKKRIVVMFSLSLFCTPPPLITDRYAYLY